jgi:hypothetical protein
MPIIIIELIWVAVVSKSMWPFICSVCYIIIVFIWQTSPLIIHLSGKVVLLSLLLKSSHFNSYSVPCVWHIWREIQSLLLKALPLGTGFRLQLMATWMTSLILSVWGMCSWHTSCGVSWYRLYKCIGTCSMSMCGVN